jgi:cell fate regulator YaaT (PSP1 superfamily)
MAQTVGVRFRQAGKIFYYDAKDFELPVSSYVVVETAHGLAVGRVVISPDQMISAEGVNQNDLKPVLRLATTNDLEKMEEMKERADQAVLSAKEKVSQQNLNMSIANGEFDLEGGQFTAYFTASERVDFRTLVRDLSREFGARVQLLQVGDRDRAKLVDGVDICGERLCCSSWMTNFPSVSIRMAKEQDLPLNPQKISGVCGRLYCCLTFEYEDYKALRGMLPKVGAMLSTPAGEARVMDIDFNREVVKLWLTEEQQQVEVAAIDFQLQHGVTIRPMELVRKIEGSMRVISEDSSRQATRPERPGRPDRPPRRDRDRGPAHAGSPPTPPPGQPEPASSSVEGQATGDGQRRRRRRRRRGGGGGPRPEGPPTQQS